MESEYQDPGTTNNKKDKSTIFFTGMSLPMNDGMRKRTNASGKSSLSSSVDDNNVNNDFNDYDDSDDDGNDNGGIDDGVDFQKYAEDMLMKRLLEKEKVEEDKHRKRQQQQQRPAAVVSSRTGLTDRELLYAAGILLSVLLCMVGILVFLLVTRK